MQQQYKNGTHKDGSAYTGDKDNGGRSSAVWLFCNPNKIEIYKQF